MTYNLEVRSQKKNEKLNQKKQTNQSFKNKTKPNKLGSISVSQKPNRMS